MHRASIRNATAFLMEGARSQRRFWKRCFCSLAALHLFLVSTSPVWPDFIYWSEAGRGEIRRANLDGTEITTLVSGLSDPSAGLMKAPGVLALLALPGFFDSVALFSSGGPR